MSENAGVFFAFAFVICGAAMIIGFCKVMVPRTSIDAEGTITSVSHTDTVSKDGDWYRIYDYVLDNTTKISLKVSMEEGGIQDEMDVGEYVYLVGKDLMDKAELDSLRASAESIGNISITVGWVAMIFITSCVVVRLVIWFCDAFRIEVTRDGEVQYQRC